MKGIIGKRASCDEKRHHVIISGTGRAGTTFLISLLTELGLDTGFSDSTSRIEASCNAGMERDIRKDGSAYIVKSPQLCDHLAEALNDGHIVIDHAFIPMRDLYSAAESRRDVVRRNAVPGVHKVINGGVGLSVDVRDLEMILTKKIYNLIFEIAKNDIPLTLLNFPRIVSDPDYLYGKLRPVFPALNYRLFREAFYKISQPKLVHSFGANQVDQEPAMMAGVQP